MGIAHLSTVTGNPVALVHDWLSGMRGGEKVLEAFCKMFPQADIYTLLHNPGSVSPTIERHRIITSFVDRLPLKATRYPWYLPLFPTAIEQFDLSGYELILSTSSCVAKGVRTPPDALHISYIHSPMRYVWDMYEAYFGPGRAGRLKRLIIPPFANYLRGWDVTSANRVDYFVANSAHVARRIWRYYRREAEVIHPLVDTSRFTLSDISRDYYLIVSALVPYKQIDLAVRAFNELQRPLYIVGSGPEAAALRRLAGSTIRFFDWVEDAQLLQLMRECRALIFPGEEDFGIVPVEAQLCGKPVIAYARGGALETVIAPQEGASGSGVFFHRPSPEALQQAVEQFEQLHWDRRFIHQHALQFGEQRFIEQMNRFISRKIRIFRGE